MTEGLSALIAKCHSEGLISGTRASRMGPTVTHLFFADDSLLFVKANRRESEMVKSIHRTYENSSGQKINFEKSALIFSRNTRIITKE